MYSCWTVPIYAPQFTVSVYKYEHTMRFQGLLTHTCTIQRPGESTIILPHARNTIDRVGEIHLLRVTGESISYIANCIHGNQKKKK